VDSKSGGQLSPRPLCVTILALEPLKGKTPWWVRRAKLEYSHIVVCIADTIWDQPWKGTAAAYDALIWLDDHSIEERDWQRIDVVVEDHDPWAFIAACKKIEGRRSQRVRTVLRHMKLWPKPAWNCVSPVIEIINALHPDHPPMTGETPDAIIAQLTVED
jgi:hypothetical protein